MDQQRYRPVVAVDVDGVLRVVLPASVAGDEPVSEHPDRVSPSPGTAGVWSSPTTRYT